MSIQIKSRVTKLYEPTFPIGGYRREDGCGIIETEQRGWYIQLEGSSESICVGDTKPTTLNVGDKVKITIERDE